MNTAFPRLVKGDVIGVFNDSFPPILDGVTLTVENYARLFQKAGFDAKIVTPWNPEDVEFPCEVIRYFSLPIASRHPYRYGYPKLDPFIWRRMRTIPFRILHSHCPFSSGRLAVYAKKYQNVPLIGTFHSKYEDDLRHSFAHAPWMVNIIMHRILAFFNACDEVWIPQAAVEETVRRYGYRGPLTVVENGSDLLTGSPDDLESEKSRARHALGIPDDCHTLLFVGQHILEKGIMVIAEALTRLHRSGVNFRMDFIGNGYALEQLRRYVDDAGLSDCVHIHGVINDRERLRLHYAAADLFLFPSFYDNAPLVVREAAAMGTPSLLLRGSTASEVISDGLNGFLTDRTPAEFAEAIMKIISTPGLAARAGRNASLSIVRRWEDIVEEVLDRYDSLISRYESATPRLVNLA